MKLDTLSRRSSRACVTERLACSVLRLRSIFSFLFLGSIFFFFCMYIRLVGQRTSRYDAVLPTTTQSQPSYSSTPVRLQRASLTPRTWLAHSRLWRGLSTAYDAGFKFVRPSCCPLQLPAAAVDVSAAGNSQNRCCPIDLYHHTNTHPLPAAAAAVFTRPAHL